MGGVKEKLKEIGKHFSGAKPTATRVNLRNGDGKVSITVDFGRLVLPDVPGLESFGSLKPLNLGRVELTPEVVLEIIERNGALCSASEEHQRVLEEWFDENFPKILSAVKRYLDFAPAPGSTPRAEAASPAEGGRDEGQVEGLRVRD